MSLCARSIPWLLVATLAACGTTVSTGGTAGSSGAGGGSTTTASGTGGASSTASASSTGGGSSASNSSSSAGTGGGCAGSGEPCAGIADWATDVYPAQPYGDAQALAMDAAGDVVVLAGATPYTALAPGLVGSVLTRYDAAGKLLWQKLYKPTSPPAPPFDWIPTARLLSVASDGAGNTYATGEVQGLLDVGGVIIDCGAMPYSGHAVFLFKLDPAGNLVWQKAFKNTCSDARVTSDAGGSLFFACSGPGADLGGGPLGGALAVARFDPSGAHVWSRGIDGSAATPRLATSPSGDVLLAGTFNGMLDFGDGPLITGQGVHLYVARLGGPSGSTVWSKEFGADGMSTWTFPNSVTADAQGDVIVGGLFSTSVDFGGGPLVNSNPADSTNDGFLVKLAGADGNHLWSLSVGGAGNQDVAGVAVTTTGALLVAGAYQNAFSLGGQTLGKPDPSGLYLAKLADANAGVLGVSTFVPITPSTGSIAAGPNGTVAVGGIFTGTVDFGPPAGSITGAKMTDPFVLVLTP